MFRKFLVAFMALAASPLLAHDEHNCLGHHWWIPAYRHEIRWQLAAFAAILLALGLYRGMRWLKRRTA